jgi:Uma2 family endonuclease
MASSSSVTGKSTPHDAPLLRQPPPSLDELARCNEEIGLLKPEDWPQVDHLVTEDDAPVDNIYAEKQQRLLTQTLYDAWQGPGAGRPFIAMANVGLFYGINRPPQVPDVLVSLDVALPADIWTKRHRSYMIWEYGKPPEVVIEIVSNKIGGEDDVKLRTYARMGVAYYVIYDPTTQLSEQVLRLYELRPTDYVALAEPWLPGVELGLMLWQGKFEDREDTWLRWCNREGQLLLTGTERAEQERQRAEQERQRAEQEQSARQQAEQQAQRLAARLRELGIDPDV